MSSTNSEVDHDETRLGIIKNLPENENQSPDQLMSPVHSRHNSSCDELVVVNNDNSLPPVGYVPPRQNEQRVTINVDGTRFSIDVSIFSKKKETLLSRMFVYYRR